MYFRTSQDKETFRLYGYIKGNPTDACVLPRIEKKELTPFDDIEIGRFLQIIKGHPLEKLFIVAVFTGMREGEILGLTWDNVDFNRNTIYVCKQLQRRKGSDGKLGEYQLYSTKNGRGRLIVAPPTVMAILKQRKSEQAEHQLFMGTAWENDMNLVFTDACGRFFVQSTIWRAFKRIAIEMGRPDARFHDLRHSYAVACIQCGDDIKIIQSNLGHATAAFTLDVYGHLTDRMKQDSARRMEQFIQSVS